MHSEDQRTKPGPAKGVQQSGLACKRGAAEWAGSQADGFRALGISRQEAGSSTLGLRAGSSRDGEVPPGSSAIAGKGLQGQGRVKPPHQHHT